MKNNSQFSESGEYAIIFDTEKYKNMIEINKNYNENNLETMAKMPDCFIDLTVTSPPYDDLRTYNGYSFDFENVAKELYRVTKEGGVVVWVVGDATKDGSESGTSFKQALYFMECGFNLHDTMIWRKPNPIPRTHNRYEQAFEYMFVFSKGKPKSWTPIKIPSKYAGAKRGGTIQQDSSGVRKPKNTDGFVSAMKVQSNVWDFAGESKTNHPAPFPEKLAYDQIRSWSNEGDLVYDPFMGSGTTAKAAISANRNWIGSEISKEYCEIIEKRLQPLRHNLFT